MQLLGMALGALLFFAGLRLLQGAGWCLDVVLDWLEARDRAWVRAQFRRMHTMSVEERREFRRFLAVR